MGILRDFEERLEGAVEGLFAKAFRSGVQPVELGKRLVRAVEDGRTVGVSRVYVPNVYTFELSAPDHARFADYEQALCAELAGLAVSTARERGWAMLGPARVELTVAEELVEGRFRLTSRVEAESQGGPSTNPHGLPPGASGPQVALLPGEQRPKPAPAAAIVVVSGAPSATLDLSREERRIGRSERADLTLADPGVSRVHARVIGEGDDYIIEDLASTNGTEVNGSPIRRRRLADGDRIRLGGVTLQFRRVG